MLDKIKGFVRSPEVQFAMLVAELVVLVVRELGNHTPQESAPPELPPRR